MIEEKEKKKEKKKGEKNPTGKISRVDWRRLIREIEVSFLETQY